MRAPRFPFSLFFRAGARLVYRSSQRRSVTSDLSARSLSLGQHRPRGRLRSSAGPSRTTRPRVQLDRIALARGDIVSSPKRATPPLFSWTLSHDATASSVGPSRPRSGRRRSESEAPDPRLQRRPAGPRRLSLAGVRLEPDCELGLAPARSQSPSAASSEATLRQYLISARSVRRPQCIMHVLLTGGAWPCAETSPSMSLRRTPYFRWEPAFLN